MLSNFLFGQNFQWAKGIGGGGWDWGNSIALDASGNIYTTGSFQGTVDFDPGLGIYNLTSVGEPDIFVLKLDGNGNFIWAKNMGGNQTDEGKSIAVDLSGNVYTTGYFDSIADFDPGVGTYTLNSIDTFDIFVSKLDANGNFVWAKHAEGYDINEGYSITVDAQGNVYSTGFFKSSMDFDPGPGIFYLNCSSSDAFVWKLDGNGNFVWAKNVGDVGYSIKTDGSNNVLVTGYFEATADFNPGPGTNTLTATGLGDAFILKLNSSGDFSWAKCMGDYGYGITADAMGNVYTTGSFLGTVDFDPGVAVFNLTTPSVAADAFISKLDQNGNFIWAKNLGGNQMDFAIAIAVNASGEVFTTGNFGNTADFDPGIGIYNLTTLGPFEIFISKLNTNGDFVWAKCTSGNSNNFGSGIAVDNFGSVYTVGSYQGTTDFDPDLGVFNLNPNGIPDVFILKLGELPLVINENNNIFSENIYPNPNSGTFNIQLNNEIKHGEIILINSLSQKVFEQKIIQGVNEIKTNKLPSGLYNCILLDDKKQVGCKKVVIE